MTEGRRIVCYNDLVAAFAARKAELNLSDALLDEVAGLTAGHSGKVLGPPPRERGIGPAVLEALLMALAVDLVMVPNPDKRAEMQPYYEGRKQNNVRTRHKPRDRTMIRVMRQLGRQSAAKMQADGVLAKHRRKGGKARMAKLTPKQRRELARKANFARWGKSGKV